MHSSWKTTTIGWGAIASAIVTLILNPYFDADPATTPNWNAFIPIVVASLTGLFTRDDSVSDEQAGAGVTSKK